MKRILHVATILGSGGLEKWLVDLAVEMDKRLFEHVILVQSDRVGVHGERAKQRGIPIVTVAPGRNPFRFALGFWRVLRTLGPFDVVHSHLHYFSGFVLALAWLGRVPVRVVHAHNDTSKWNSSRARAIYASVSRMLISAFATQGFGVSDACARELFGKRFGRDSRWRVLPCGISLVPFRMRWDRERVAAELGFSPGSFVIAQIARFDSMKNHEFSLDLLAKLEIPNALLLLVGEGEMKEQLQQMARALGVSDRVIFAGTRSDIPRVLCTVVDVFILPSRPGEGASIAATEAQAAGLPCLLSESAPESTIIVQGLAKRIPIESGTGPWIAAIQRIHAERASISREETTKIVEASEFSIKSNCKILTKTYSSG